MSDVPVLVLRSAAAAPYAWERALPDVRTLDGEAAFAEQVRAAGAVVADVSAADALDLLRRARSADDAVQPVVVVPESERAQLERAIRFAPGLGEVWLAAPGEVGTELLARASDVTSSRRSYRHSHARMQLDLRALEPRTQRSLHITDAYLAALLDASPDPIISVDDAGRVLTWNPGAEQTLGQTREAALGRPLRDLLIDTDGTPLLDAFDAHRRDIRFRREGGEEGQGELIVLPIDAGGQRIRAVLVRDLTPQRQAQTALEAQTGELEAQAAELEEQAAELARINDELEQALSARGRFYAAMSHELRTPINAILGFQDLILAGLHGELSDGQRNALERAQRAARHLVELVNDVLDIAKIEAGRIELTIEPAPFPALIGELLDTTTALAGRHGSTISVRGEGRHTIASDPRRLRQILLNLLSNAIKYGEGRPIEVNWDRQADGGIRIQVCDHGRGIAPEDMGRIFEEFTQVGANAGEGTGLGLAISRRLAHLLGGELSAASTPGEGSTFTLTLPAHTPADQA